MVLASGGYPGAFPDGQEDLRDRTRCRDAVVFHAGTRQEGDGVVTSGGRVLGVTATGPDLKDSIDRAYTAVGRSTSRACITDKISAQRA